RSIATTEKSRVLSFVIFLPPAGDKNINPELFSSSRWPSPSSAEPGLHERYVFSKLRISMNRATKLKVYENSRLRKVTTPLTPDM
ncbi:MAG TPA: hypothetical protein VJ572_06285, partial [Azonexus sp.]|nr:hypothetical protein [Azonexus sp.]